METSLIITITICVLILAVSLIMPILEKLKKKKNIKELIFRLKTEGININKYDSYENFIIGVDTEQKILIYKKEGSSLEKIFIEDISSCSNNIPENGKFRDDLYLILERKNTGTKSELEIFNHSLGINPVVELKIINRWQEFINNMVK